MNRLLTSFAKLQRVEPGFEPDGIFSAQLVMPPQCYPREKLVAFYESLYQRLSTLPGITGAALTDRVPLTGGAAPAPVAVVGRPLPPMSERPNANRHLVSPKYLRRSAFRSAPAATSTSATARACRTW